MFLANRVQVNANFPYNVEKIIITNKFGYMLNVVVKQHKYFRYFLGLVAVSGQAALQAESLKAYA